MKNLNPSWIEGFRKQALSLRQQVILCVAVTLAYIVVRLTTMTSSAGWFVAFSLVPLIMIAWVFGILTGVIAGVLLFFFNFAIDNFQTPLSWQTSLEAGGTGELLFLLLTAVLFGFMGGLARQLRLELNERLQSEERARRYASRLENLRRANISISSTLNLNEALEAILTYSAEVLPYDSAAVFLKVENAYMLVAGRGFKDIDSVIGLKINLDNYFFRKICETKTAIILENASQEKHFKVWATGQEIRGWMGLPLLWQEEVIGIFTVDSCKPGAYSETELDLAQDFARQASIVIQKARLLEEANRRAEEAEILRQMGLALTTLLPREEIIDIVLEQLMRVVPCDTSSLLVVDGEEAVIVGGRGFPNIRKVLGLRVQNTPNTPVFIVLTENRALILPNAPAEYPIFHAEPHVYTVSLLCVPLYVRGQPLGVLSLDSMEENHFTADHARLAMSFASQVAIALDNSHFLEEIRRQARETETLRQAGMAITALLPREEMIDRVAEQMMQVVPCDSTSVMLIEGDELVVVGGRGFQDLSQVLGRRFAITPEIPSYTVIQTRLPIILANALQEFPAMAQRSGQKSVSFMSVPLLVRERVIGVLAMDSLKENHFNSRHADLAMAFASQVAIAVENSLLFDGLRELTIIDPLTGLFSRRHFFEISQAALDQALRYHHPLSLIMMDVDRFKSFNDTCGHLLGDRILKRFGQNLRQGLRTSDIAARYGGDEFVVLLPETDADEALLAADRLLQAIRQPFEDEAGTFTLSASIGLASLKEYTVKCLEDLLDQADKAMYVAKSAGGNRIVG